MPPMLHAATERRRDPALLAAGLRSLRAAPITVPCLGIVVLLAWFAADRGGYPVSTWAPGAIVALALLAVALWTVPNDWRAVPRTIVAAAALLALYALWSFASIAWAGDPGAAWEGSNRTLMYVVIFCLFALWPQRTQTAAVILGLWVLAIGGIALVEALRVPLVSDPRTLFSAGRLMPPAGYPNATAAVFLMAFWPAVALAASRRVPPLLRAVFAAAAVLTFDVSLLALSRGAVLGLPICAVAFLAFVPGRLRHLVTLVPIAIGCAAAVPSLIHLTDVVGVYQPPPGIGAADAAGRAMLVGALAVALVVGLVALLEVRRPPAEATAARLRRVGHVGFGAAAAVAVLAALVVMGNPVTRVDDAWSSFKGGYSTDATGSRLGSGLGSNRYDFYRVAVDVFRDHPLAGIGADNFFQQYLRDGRSDETPSFPHSIELRALTQTGVIGALLLFGAFAAALAAVWRAVRARPLDDLAAAVAGGAAIAFVYWLVHGSADWFFEFPGLSIAAFAMLGLAASLGPRRGTVPLEPGAGDDDADSVTAPPLRRPSIAVLAPVTAVLVLAAVALFGLWGADHEVKAAAKTYAKTPNAAYERLDRARTLDPFSDRADSLAGSIAGRLGDLGRADAGFGRALSRVPEDQYATLERGVIASAAGRRRESQRLLTRAAELAPRDPITREALEIVRSGGTLDLAAVNRRILTGAQQFSR
jgi:tetratricopeptide (TPR) repeat protein